MNRIKNALIAFGSLSLLIGAIALVTPRPTQGQAGDPVGPTKPVNVVNTSSEPVPVTGTINVGNFGSSPLPVRDVDNGRQPFHVTDTILIAIGEDNDSKTVFTVPAGKRLIIETITARAVLEGVDTPNIIDVLTTVGNKLAFHELLVTKQGQTLTGGSAFVGTHYVRAYADPGTDVVFRFSRSDITKDGAAAVTISGYFVDVP